MGKYFCNFKNFGGLLGQIFTSHQIKLCERFVCGVGGVVDAL